MRPTRPSSSRENTFRRWSWTVLLALLLGTWIGAFFHTRTDWPAFLPGEATYLMQADSLLQDFDLSYTRADFDRFLLKWNQQPTDLSLASIDGKRIGFEAPFWYALWLAPFLSFWPVKGFAIANVFLLTLVALWGAIVLERRVGIVAPFWMAVILFGSVVFAHTFLVTGSFFTFALGALAFLCLEPAFDGREDRGTRGTPWRYWFSGALLAILFATQPIFLCLLLAALLIPSGRDGARCRSLLLLGFAISLAMMTAVTWWTSGNLLFLWGKSFRFTVETGFPLVDFTAVEWTSTVQRLMAFHWEGAPRLSFGFDGRLWLWNSLYLAVGRNFGLLPYFAPVLLLILTSELDRRRQALFGSLVLWVLAILMFKPFAFQGVQGTIGAALFLPIYGALIMLPARIPRSFPQLCAGAIAVLLLAAPFMWRVWSGPGQNPIQNGGGYTYVTPVAESILPYETSQRWIPAEQTVEYQGLWVRFLNDGAWSEVRKERLMVDGDAEVHLMIGTDREVEAFRFEFGEEAPSSLEVRGAQLGERVLLPDGGIAFQVLPGFLKRRHATWWTPEPLHIYLLTLRLPEAGETDLAFRLLGEWSP